MIWPTTKISSTIANRSSGGPSGPERSGAAGPLPLYVRALLALLAFTTTTDALATTRYIAFGSSITEGLNFEPNEMEQEATQFTVSSTVPELCEADAVTLCIDNQPGDRRFKIKMSWHTALNGGQSGEAFATPLADIGLEFGGILSFFPGNPEVLIKVLNGCGFNDRFWILGSATTNLGFDLTIEDTLAGLQGAPPSMHQYNVSNTAGDAAAPFFDILAFDTCDYTQ